MLYWENLPGKNLGSESIENFEIPEEWWENKKLKKRVWEEMKFFTTRFIIHAINHYIIVKTDCQQLLFHPGCRRYNQIAVDILTLVCYHRPSENL